MSEFIGVSGLVLLVVGVGMLSIPAALIVLGLCLLVFAGASSDAGGDK